jgi:hypothetical protein
MSQRSYCPACTDWEIIPNGCRDDSWKCSKCGATMSDCPEVVVRLGNHYMTSRPSESLDFATKDHTIARRYPFHVAEIIRDNMSKSGQTAYLYTPAAIAREEDKRAKERARSAYFHAFTDEVGRLARLDGKPLGEHWTYYIPGCGCASTVYGVDPAIASGLDPYAAAEKWYASNPPKRVRKPSKSKATA